MNNSWSVSVRWSVPVSVLSEESATTQVTHTIKKVECVSESVRENARVCMRLTAPS